MSKGNKIPESDWLQVYSGIKLLEFYKEVLNENDQKNLGKARDKYKEIVKKSFSSDNIDAIPNLFSLIYLTLVRIHEVFNRYLDDKCKNKIYDTIEVALKLKDKDGFKAIYDIDIIEQ